MSATIDDFDRMRFVILDRCPRALVVLLDAYIALLDLPDETLFITTNRKTYAGRIGRQSIPARYGGAYCYVRCRDEHAILINLQRIDQQQSKALEIVVAEELIHMRHWLDGDRRGHAKHGYDRIAIQVADLTGATLDEVRSALLPVERRPYRYVYSCPTCNVQIFRRRRGSWACAPCARKTGRITAAIRFRLVGEITAGEGTLP